jgi:nucleoside diphosphate kinase
MNVTVTVTRVRTLGFVKPDAMNHMGKILDIVWQSGLQITQLKMMHLRRDEATEFYADKKSTALYRYRSVRVSYLAACLQADLLAQRND